MHLNWPYLAKYAYLGSPNMVKWGVPEQILQNVVQTRCSKQVAKKKSINTIQIATQENVVSDSEFSISVTQNSLQVWSPVHINQRLVPCTEFITCKASRVVSFLLALWDWSYDLCGLLSVSISTVILSFLYFISLFSRRRDYILRWLGK